MHATFLVAALVSSATTVFPTGSFPLDVENVQAAIDAGGTVVLKATSEAGVPTPFDFGPPDPVFGTGVSLTTDVEIIGERIGGHQTTITGGNLPILGFLPVKVQIRGIRFVGPVFTAILLVASTGADIVDNHIDGVVPGLLGVGFTQTDGIDVFGDENGAITGRVRIVGNVIEGLVGDFANGVQLDGVSAQAELVGNVVRYAESSNVVNCIGLTALRSTAAVSIAGNTISMGPGSADAFPLGIFIGGDADARYVVSVNSVVVDHPNGEGLAVLGGFSFGPTEEPIVIGNHVTTRTTFPMVPALELFGDVENALVAANRIEGQSPIGLGVGLDGPVADANTLVGNDLSRHTSSVADVYLGASSTNTLVAGRCMTRVDLGTGNRILCGGR